MAFDRNYPVTNSTPWNTLYAGLRSQFTALDDLTDDEIAWTSMSLVTGWVNYGSGVYVCRYKKDGMGFVRLAGVAMVSAGASPGTVVTTLPAACVPTKNVILKGAYDISVSGVPESYYYINTSGQIICDTFTPAEYDEVRFHCQYYHVGR